MTKQKQIANIVTIELIALKKHSRKTKAAFPPINTTGSLSLYGTEESRKKTFVLFNATGEEILREEITSIHADEKNIYIDSTSATYVFRKTKTTDKDPEEGRKEKWSCPRCGRKNHKQSLYCDICRTPHWDHEITCRNCNTKVPVTISRCPKCETGIRYSVITDWLNRHDPQVLEIKRSAKRSMIAFCGGIVLSCVIIIAFFLLHCNFHSKTEPTLFFFDVLHCILAIALPLTIFFTFLQKKNWHQYAAEAHMTAEAKMFYEADSDDFMPYV